MVTGLTAEPLVKVECYNHEFTTTTCTIVRARVCDVLVKMPSRSDTLRWLGDDVDSLSAKVADILKLDACKDASASSPAATAGRPRSSGSGRAHENAAAATTHPEAVFSDSFSPESKRHDELQSASEGPRPTADAVADAVGELTVVADKSDDDVSETSTSSSSSSLRPTAAAAAASAAEAAPVDNTCTAGATGGPSNDSLFNLLSQFADDTVRGWCVVGGVA